MIGRSHRSHALAHAHAGMTWQLGPAHFGKTWLLLKGRKTSRPTMEAPVFVPSRPLVLAMGAPFINILRCMFSPKKPKTEKFSR